MKSDIILKAENLCFSYDKDSEEKVLDVLSLEIKRGQKVAVMGSNGSGKSTFFLCCNGINKPQSGKLFFDGKEVSYDRKSLLELRSKVGIVFQDPDNQLFSASVYQEISFGVLNTGKSEEEARHEVDRVIEHLEITPFRDKPAHALSGGQKKQVAIADILVMHPELIILDEPASALDPRHKSIMENIVNGLTEEGITVLMATHDADYAYEWADEVMIFNKGKLLTRGAPEKVFREADNLAESNLEEPGVLRLFDSLTEHRVLPENLPLPRSMRELEQCLKDNLK